MLFYDSSVWKDLYSIVFNKVSPVPSFANRTVFVNSWLWLFEYIGLHLLFPLIEIRLLKIWLIELKIKHWLFHLLLDLICNFLLSCFNLLHIKAILIILRLRCLIISPRLFVGLMNFPKQLFISLKFLLKGS